MTSSFSLEYVQSLLGESFTQEVTLKQISEDLGLLKIIVSKIKGEPLVEPFISIYQWCLQQAKICIKQDVGERKLQLNNIISIQSRELEAINKKINNHSGVNKRRELDNQDLSRAIFLERKLSLLSEEKTLLENIDSITNFDDVVAISY